MTTPYTIQVLPLFPTLSAAQRTDNNVEHRTRCEFPPHPSRLFSAIVASLAGESADSDTRAALEWLEALPPPRVLTPPHHEESHRIAFCPVAGTTGLAEAADPRDRRDRAWATAALGWDDATNRAPSLYYCWDADEPGILKHSPVIERLVSHISYVGSSVTPSVARVLTEVPETPTDYIVWRPEAERPRTLLRVPTPGRFLQLRDEYEQAQHYRQQLPSPGNWHGYTDRRVEDEPPQRSLWSDNHRDWFVFRIVTHPLALAHTAQLTRSIRRALIASADQPVREVLAGHDPDDNTQSRMGNRPALIPLADINHVHADGHLMGFAVVLPADINDDDRRHCVTAIARLHDLTIRGIGRVRIKVELHGRGGLSPESCLGHERNGAHVWSTVTPLTLDQHPHSDAQIQDIVRAGCTYIGLREPDMIIPRVSFHRGLPGLSRRWSGDRPDPILHLTVGWTRAIRGPLFLGRGRYRGLGLLAPVPTNLIPRWANTLLGLE